MKKVLIQATDTDIVVLAIAVASIIDCEIWVTFSHDQNLHNIPCHELSLTLGTDTSKGVVFFHAFTGCDVCCSFHGNGKKTVRAL